MGRLAADAIKVGIGRILLSTGAHLLASFRCPARCSRAKPSVLGTIPSFATGVSGGGYGPLVTGGQIMSGVGVKNAMGITSLSEGVTCLIGAVVYCVLRSDIDWTLAPWLATGALLSVPCAAQTLKRIPERPARLAVVCVILLLGGRTLGKGLVRV